MEACRICLEYLDEAKQAAGLELEHVVASKRAELDHLTARAKVAGYSPTLAQLRAFFIVEYMATTLPRANSSAFKKGSMRAQERPQVLPHNWPRSREGLTQLIATMQELKDDCLLISSEARLRGDTGGTEAFLGSREDHRIKFYQYTEGAAATLRSALNHDSVDGLWRLGKSLAQALKLDGVAIGRRLEIGKLLIDQTEHCCQRGWAANNTAGYLP